MSERTTIIESSSAAKIDFREVYEYRQLVFLLAYRDIKVRYAQTFLGLLWTVLKPAISLVVFTIFFGKLLGVAGKLEGDVPYEIFAFAGMSAWTYFSFLMTSSGTVVKDARGMISKIYFPRLVLPLSKAIVGLVDYAIGLVLMFILMLIYQVPFTATIVWLPVFILATLLTSLSIGIWVSALTIRYRDLQFLLPFIIQMLFYLTPVVYPPSLVESIGLSPEIIYYINPMAGVIDGFRYSLIGGEMPPPTMWVSVGITILMLIGGLLYFKKVERTMVDIL